MKSSRRFRIYLLSLCALQWLVVTADAQINEKHLDSFVSSIRQVVTEKQNIYSLTLDISKKELKQIDRLLIKVGTTYEGFDIYKSAFDLKLKNDSDRIKNIKEDERVVSLEMSDLKPGTYHLTVRAISFEKELWVSHMILGL